MKHIRHFENLDSHTLSMRNFVTCDGCHGNGEIQNYELCPTCDGNGKYPISIYGAELNDFARNEKMFKLIFTGLRGIKPHSEFHCMDGVYTQDFTVKSIGEDGFKLIGEYISSGFNFGCFPVTQVTKEVGITIRVSRDMDK